MYLLLRPIKKRLPSIDLINNIFLFKYLFILIPFTLIIFLIPISSCSSGDTDGNEVFIFQNKLDKYFTSKFISDMKFIPLETNEECIIGTISKVLFSKGKYYILDSKSAKQIFVFDSLGKYLLHIGKIGKGPGEFIRPVDFCIDNTANYILIIDADRKIIKVDLNGNFILEKKPPVKNRALTNIESDNGIIYAYTGQRMSNERKVQVIQLDSNLNPVKWILPYKYSSPLSVSFNNALYTYDDKINFISAFNNCMYQAEGGDFIKRFIFNFEGIHLSLKDVTDEQFLSNTTNAWFFYNCVEGNDLIFLPVFDKGRPKYGFLLKKNNKFLLINEIIEDSATFIPPVSCFNGKFIATISSSIFLKKMPESHLQLKVTDNPVIVEYKIQFKDEK